MKKLLVLMFGSLLVFAANAQEEPAAPEKGFDNSKLFVGGYFGLSFGNATFINISPQVGYRFNKFFAAGVGINGQYSSFKTDYTDGTTTRENYGVFGLNIFGR